MNGAGGRDVVVSALVHDRIPQGLRAFAFDPDFVPEVARVARPRNHHGDAGELRGDEPEVAELLPVLLATDQKIISFGEVRKTVEDLYVKISRNEVM